MLSRMRDISRKFLLSIVGLMAMLTGAAIFVAAESGMAWAEDDRVRFVIRSNETLLLARIDLHSCIDDDQKINTLSNVKFLGIAPELHTGHHYSLRVARWPTINSGSDEDSEPEVQTIIRSELTFRLITSDGELPLLFDKDQIRYVPACKGAKTIAAPPNVYPTIVIDAAPDGGGRDRLPGGHEKREKLLGFLAAQEHLPFLVAGAAPLPLPGGARGKEPKMRDWVVAAFRAGPPAFLAKCPERVTLTVDGSEFDGEIESLKLNCQPAPVPVAAGGGGSAPNDTPSSPQLPPAATGAVPAGAVPAGALPTGALQGAPARFALILNVPDVLAPYNLETVLKETGNRCPGPWRRLADDPRVYQVECGQPPPYDIGIGSLLPVRSLSTERIVKADELMVRLPAKLVGDWPKERFSDGVVWLGPISLRDFVSTGSAISMFPDAPADSPGARTCVAVVKGEIGTAVFGPPPEVPPPCVTQTLNIPDAWRQRVRGQAYPVVDGCLGDQPGVTCLRSTGTGTATGAAVTVTFGPGWEPATLPAASVNPAALAQRLRPQWPYAAILTATGDGNNRAARLMVTSIAYCADSRGESCCGGGELPGFAPRAFDSTEPLPTLTQAGCSTAAALPRFGIASFVHTTGEATEYRFRRYWTISAVSGRPYQIPWAETVRTYPIRLLGSDRLAVPSPAELRLALFGSLLACQRATANDDGLDAFPLHPAGDYDHQVSLPVFAQLKGAAGAVSQCAEGVLDPADPPTVVFTLEPSAGR